MTKQVTPQLKLNSEMIKGFVNLFLKNSFDSPAEIPWCHEDWWRMCTSEDAFVAIAAPRNHAKSTAITHSYTLANICFRIHDFVLIVSDTEAQAGYFLNDIKKEVVNNEDLKRVFGIVSLDKDAETDMIINFEDGYQARILAKGAEQKLRGLKWNNKRPNLIVIDDCENDEIVMNEDRRKKFRGWFSSALIPCRSSNGKIRFIGTILHLDSMLARLMPKEFDKTVRRSPLSIHSSYGSAWKSAMYWAHTPNFDHILWPERWPREKLEAERKHYISQGQSDKYSQEYLNKPIDEDNSFFRKSDFIPMNDKDRLCNKVYYVGVDLAVTLKQSSDYTVFVIGGVDENHTLHIVDVIKERLDSMQIVEMLIQLNKRYNPQYFFFEKGALTNSILPHVKVAMNESNSYFIIEMFNRGVDKVQFAQTIRARMRAHRVRFDQREGWFPDFESECLRFPRDIHDDEVDALAILGRGVEKFVEAPSEEELEEEEYKEAFEMSDLYEQGRSEITGY